jgi:3-phenylpropionate/cinnamic acid dioxygenase small subunit
MIYTTIIEIQQLIFRFANCFDLKDWEGLGSCLTDVVHTDYSQLRGTLPGDQRREDFVSQRRIALDSLKTQHLCSNIVVGESMAGAHNVKATMVIYRRDQNGQVFNTHCIYDFAVLQAAERWRIASITQNVLWNDGQQTIHVGASGS